MDESVEHKAEQLARLAADRAAKLALVDADKATVLAVERAVKDANIDRDLADHSKHLEEINGSQRQMAASLAALVGEQTRQTAATEAVAKAVEKRQRWTLSRWQIAGVVAAYGGILVAVLLR